ncbi:hypothetical protein HIM_03345 [Hirsutella minnesotensis 3608]|uniref:Gamma-glutamylcyclotransferase n=1 Tax=Hirsutella minnesotensis 3608 TaxID=1043627 RepID=A0A0F8A6G2_9HYPO|nr:hypothetical protein HIM_03345 [Hirsutella minnesotensis 3608]
MDSQQDSEGGSQPSQGSSVMTATPEARREILYFAYGSNLSTDQMRRRCPHSTPQLDRFEGVPWAYEKMRCQVRWVRDGDGRPVCGDALEEEGDGPPRQEYVGRMETAIADAVANWGLPEDYADRVMRKALVGKRAKGKGASKGTAR